MINKRILFSLILMVSVPLFLVGCGSKSAVETPAGTSSNNTATATISNSPPVIPTFVPATPLISPQPGSTVGSPFLPGEVLAGLPVYPGAVPTMFLNDVFGSPLFPAETSLYGARRPGFQSALAQYTAQETDGDIMNWYLAQLGALGYRHSGEAFSGSPTITRHSIAFFLPSQPLVSVEVHVYTTLPNTSISPVFELLVTYTVPLPKPPEESLPGDINSIQIDYAPGTANAVVKTVTDAQSVKGLVNMVNNLPIRPDHIFLGGPGLLDQTLFRLVFHSTSQGDVIVTDITGKGIGFGSYPALDDPHNLLQEAVKQALGITGG